MNKVLLKKNIKAFLKDVFFIKTVIKKLVIILCCIILIVIPAFIIRDFILKADKANMPLIANFLEINIVYNTGLGFSLANNLHPNIVLLMQILFSLIPLMIFIFTKNINFSIGTSFMFTGALCNIIDRIIDDNFTILFGASIVNNAVIDYLTFSFLPQIGIFNWADIFISIGFIILIISFIIYFIKSIINDNKKAKIIKNEKNNC